MNMRWNHGDVFSLQGVYEICIKFRYKKYLQICILRNRRWGWKKWWSWRLYCIFWSIRRTNDNMRPVLRFNNFDVFIKCMSSYTSWGQCKRRLQRLVLSFFHEKQKQYYHKLHNSQSRTEVDHSNRKSTLSAEATSAGSFELLLDFSSYADGWWLLYASLSASGFLLLLKCSWCLDDRGGFSTLVLPE